VDRMSLMSRYLDPRQLFHPRTVSTVFSGVISGQYFQG
jgi:hypothetical protein